ncbi:MAG: hypothetical protein VKQ33_07510 [Candidatus Sericytochromatia bacterium]|nr:hypothetical protein [Candidatus Sericytochromatia bacterium]
MAHALTAPPRRPSCFVLWLVAAGLLGACHWGQAPGAARGLPLPEAGAPTAPPGPGSSPPEPLLAAPEPAAGWHTVEVPLDRPEASFVDPVSPAGRSTRAFFPGLWVSQGGLLEQRQGLRLAALTFRRYAGDAFGAPGGKAPARYRTDLQVWVYQPSSQYPGMVGAPLGVLGFAPYFVDERRYLLAVAKPEAYEVWAVDGQRPGTLWPSESRLLRHVRPAPLTLGAAVSWSIAIDTARQEARVWADGQELGAFTTPLLTHRGQSVALVSNGNFVRFRDLRLSAP